MLGYIQASAFPLRKFFRVTDAWFLKFVRQRENCQSLWIPHMGMIPIFSFRVTLYTPPIPIKTRKLSYRKDDRAMPCALGYIIKGALKIFDSSTATFPEIFNVLLFQSILWMRIQNSEVRSLPVPEIIPIAVLGWGCEPPILGRGGHRGSGMVPFERALVSSYRPSTVNFPLSLRDSARSIVAFVLQHATFSHPTAIVSQKFPP